MLSKYAIKSPWLFRINTGSCNGCDVELATTALIPRYDVERLGCKYTGSPKHADIVLVTGPVTARSEAYLIRLLDEIPEPRVVVAVGICPISGGVFRDSYSIRGPLDKYVEVDVNVCGCPVRPQSIIDGVAQAISIWKEKIAHWQEA
ncbi:NADH ubiquinone oxidoreductase [Desulfolithobacter dissulfuricans]|uniref:NADH ubiquinone oxidoreductase n=1 Tax=Desulfolithobacter dissulfuricans TaxID=2795293 RepID=A0A915XL99_9BACT|nr:NADH:ubiquinone oxidoreductase [Desulfolithobacter dissulfuricans]BCO09416.1 NADH ubiquinone oxidoreductase [Desulfolithobacter dissulfuricans]